MAKEIEAEREGAKCLAISADVRDIKSMERAVEQTIEEFGRIDVVIAGAAGNFLSTIDVCSTSCVPFTRPKLYLHDSPIFVFIKLG